MAFVGLEVLFKSAQTDLRCKEDALVVVLHYLLIQDGLKCTGTTEASQGQKGSELLPPNWNSNSDVYTLYYANQNNTSHFIFKAVKAGRELLLNLLNIETNAASAYSVTVDNFVSDNFTDFDSAFVQLDTLKNAVVTNVLDEVKRSPSSSQPRREEEERRRRDVDDDDPLRIPGTGNMPYYPSSTWREGVHPYNVGASDLDPLGGRGGGMLMDPRNPMFGRGFDPSVGIPGRLPRGAVPPGARFDPFGPPAPGTGPRGGNRFARPDPDHLPPPGYDDMFM